jgi:hypothetical protein
MRQEKIEVRAAAVPIKRIELLKPEPGDTIVVYFEQDNPVRMTTLRAIRDTLAAAFPDRRILLIEGDLRVELEKGRA